MIKYIAKNIKIQLWDKILTNLNQLFIKSFIQNTQIQIPTEPQTSTYAMSIQSDKKRYNYITQSYIENIYKTQTY